ncbi:hypothetical protein P8C59_001295 [Phyllachora maydis]|uniref:Uncharacterized protein n=1 Tax=Phyllachora maydis TaxID=1825666 RepID=A0AAD9HZA2_9PEZI|nr:hypothetical protein P8C59_001295 [Phyllachora maydis]
MHAVVGGAVSVPNRAARPPFNNQANSQMGNFPSFRSWAGAGYAGSGGLQADGSPMKEANVKPSKPGAQDPKVLGVMPRPRMHSDKAVVPPLLSHEKDARNVIGPPVGRKKHEENRKRPARVCRVDFRSRSSQQVA